MEISDDVYNELVTKIVDKIMLSLEETLFLPQSFNCVYEIDFNTLRDDLHEYIYNHSSR